MEETNIENMFGRLPDEIILSVLVAVDNVKSIAAWAATSERHWRLSLDRSLWRHLCESHFGPSPFEEPLPYHATWRWIYRAQSRPARPTGVDVGAVWIDQALGQAFWGDVLDGKPSGFGLTTYAPCGIRQGLLRKKTTAGRALGNFERAQGQWTEGRLHGFVIETDRKGKKIKRCWTHGEPDAHGRIVCPLGAYVGAISGKSPHGYGVLTPRGGSSIARQWDATDRVDFFDNGDVRVTPKKPQPVIYVWDSGSRYDGEEKDQDSHGHGILVDASGCRYEGGWRNGRKHGHGTMVRTDGWRYEGEWSKGLGHGHGTLIHPSGARYEGSFSQGLRHGHGTYTWPNGSSYVGDWRNGKRDGCGTMVTARGWRYQGEWSEGLSHGRGTQTWPNGDSYVGDWQRDDMHGHGTMTYRDGRCYVGDWQRDEMHGHGTMTYSDGRRYVGHFCDGMAHGMGIMTFCNGDMYEGSCCKGRRRGRGTMSFADGSRLLATWDDTNCADSTVILHCAPGQTRDCREDIDRCCACRARDMGRLC
jgi:hypothetical protein